ncbi:heavy metal-responsive transcriptional regulator [Persephonella sp.]
MKYLTRGKLANKTGINPETLRYYEKIGLLQETLRSETGYRLYTEEDIKKVEFIKRAKELGFTLKEIKELLYLRFEKGSKCSEVKALAQEKLKNIEERINNLEKIKKLLQDLINKCPDEGSVDRCPIIIKMEK